MTDGDPATVPSSAGIDRRYSCGNISRDMAVNPELLKILVCPLCKATVNLTESGQGLKCSQCSRVYPIRDDIPVMLLSEAKIED